MGAEQFIVKAVGKNADEAFSEAVSYAEYDHGHSGYTGTIAEKTSFTQIRVPKGKDPYEFAQGLLNEGDPRVDDKWGPAGCISLGVIDNEKTYLFFGWASS